MSDKGRTFRSERSRNQMIAIDAALKTLTLATVAEVAGVVCIAKCTVGDYLRHMEKVGRVHCAVPATMNHGAGVPAMWALGPSPIDLADHEEIEVDTAPQRVIVRQEWDGTAVRRDPLVEALFGKAA